MENFKLELPISLEPEVAIEIRKYLGTRPTDDVGLGVIVSLDNAISSAAQAQIKASEDAKVKELPKK